MAFRGCLFALPFAIALYGVLGLLAEVGWNTLASRFHLPPVGFLGATAAMVVVGTAAGILVMRQAMRGAMEVE